MIFRSSQQMISKSAKLDGESLWTEIFRLCHNILTGYKIPFDSAVQPSV